MLAKGRSVRAGLLVAALFPILGLLALSASRITGGSADAARAARGALLSQASRAPPPSTAASRCSASREPQASPRQGVPQVSRPRGSAGSRVAPRVG